ANGDKPFYGITSISYSDNQEIENQYGAGNMPVSRGFGQYTAEASLTLTMEEVEKIQESVATARLQDIPEFNL
ncbi:hypothetical protein, partial [Xanthovirga aplysinae]|uniref:hypothetical protein n=1 Tax=Xanthovirga aplysinae TaxID=2529853 RepID=UPI001CA4257F